MRKPTKFPALVMDEAKNLKKFATKEELDRLDIYTLDSNDKTKCIYGQTTGDCMSDRAIELIKKCAKRVYHASPGSPGDSKKLNGSPNKINRRGVAYCINYFSPIEVFIDRADIKMNGKLIDYLQGKRKRLQ